MWRHDTAQGLAFLGGRDAGISETGKDKVSLYLSFSVAAASVWAPVGAHPLFRLSKEAAR